MAKPRKSGDSPGLTSRRASLDILALVRAGRSLDEALAACRSFDALEGPDRAFARALATTVLRRRGTLDHLIGPYLDRPLPPRAARVMDILRLAGAQTIILGTPAHAAVSTATSLAGDRRETAGYAGLVNAIARKLAASGPAGLAKLPNRVDTPGWLWRSWERAYGPTTTRAIAEAHRKEPTLDLTLRVGEDPQVWAERLSARLLPTGSLRLENAGDVAALPGYEDGAWWVQDAAAALPALLLGDLSGKRVFDLCAAPGGKTLQLAAAGAAVVAVDKSGARLKRIAENLARTKLAAEKIAADILEWTPADKADAVLLDAPCSATGTIRRHPDILWSKAQEDVAALAVMQSAMIDRAADFLKPGGVLVYCVCSLQPEEGEQQIEATLARRPDLARKPVTPVDLPGLSAAATKTGDLRTLPSMLADEGGLDGFFAARLIKTG